MFPGQGSQSVGMFADLSELGSSIEDRLAQASDLIDVDLVDIVRNGPAELLNQTANTQPALLAGSFGLFELFQDKCHSKPDVMAGHSLGEYTALTASGALEFETAIQLVRRRGELMQEAVPIGHGAMAAVLGLDDDQLREVCDSVDGTVSPANFNSPGQIVIAGEKSAVEAASERCTAKGASRVIPIDVSVPSHCPLMDSAADKFSEVLAATTITPPSIPIFQNVDTKPTQDADVIREKLAAQLNSPVLWHQSVHAMAQTGIDTFIECGPGKILTGLMRRIDRSLSATAVGDLRGFTKMVES